MGFFYYYLYFVVQHVAEILMELFFILYRDLWCFLIKIISIGIFCCSYLSKRLSLKVLMTAESKGISTPPDTPDVNSSSKPLGIAILAEYQTGFASVCQ